MPNPLKMRTHANGVYSDGFQVTTNAELDYVSKLLLTKYATESGSGDNTGDLNIDSLGTSVGTFEDTFATGELDSHPYGGANSSVTYTFKQNNSTSSEASYVPLLTHDGTSNPGHIRVLTDSEINAVIDLALADIAKANSTAAGTGTYYIGESAPSISGTWVAQDQFFDEVTNNANDDDQKTTYKLWRKTSYDSTPSAVKLLKRDGISIKEVTSSEIETLSARLRNRIIATGIGTYKFQATAPGTGTWVARGTATDRNPTITNIQYTGSYSGQYGRQFSREFQRQFTADYTRGQFDRQYTNLFQRVYSANYSVEFARSFLRVFQRGVVGTQYARGQYTRQFTGQYTRQFTRQFTADYQRTFARIYSAQYARIYTNNFTRLFDGPAYTKTFSGEYSRGDQYTGQYTRIYNANYDRSFLGTQYTRIYSANYARIYSAQYTGQYTRQFTAQYSRIFSAGYARIYTAQYERQFARPFSRQFERSEPFLYPDGIRYVSGPTGGYITPSPSYIGVYSRAAPYYGPPTIAEPLPPDEGAYIRGAYLRLANQYIIEDWELRAFKLTSPGPLPNTTFDRQVSYSRTAYTGASYSGSTNYAGAQYDRSTPGPNYSRATTGPQYARLTTGPQYTRGQYGRITPGPSYARATTGPQYTRILYTVSYLRTVVGPQYTRGQFTRAYDGFRNYGTYTRQFSGLQYEGQFARDQYTRNTPGPNFDGLNYARLIVGNQYDGLQYSRLTVGPQYEGQFTRQFVGDYTREFLRGDVYSRQFLRQTPGPQFEGSFTRTQYTGLYARDTSGLQYSDGQYTIQYDGARDRQYTGATVTSTYITSTKTLWLRVA